MPDDEENIELQSITQCGLRAARAIELVEYLQAELYEYAHLQDLFCTETYDVIEVIVDVEIPQRTVHDIRHQEPLFIAFAVDDSEAPRVLPGREDFPDSLPHLDMHAYKIAGIADKSLCLSNLEYSNRKLRWTSYSFLEEIRTWLSKTAVDELHAEDQALEPFFFKTNQTLVMSESFINEHLEASLIKGVSFWGTTDVNKKEFILFTQGDFYPEGQIEKNFQGLVFETPAVLHGVINKTPRNLDDLSRILAETEFDLISSLRSTLRPFFDDIEKERNLLLIIKIPKKRREDGPIEGSEIFAFTSIQQNMGEICEDIGICTLKDGEYGYLLNDDESKIGQNINIEILNVIEPFTEKNAQKYSALKDTNLADLKIVTVGLGSLGSQAFDKLFRTGIGKWALIDQDTLFPHNLSRHQLDGAFIGWPKAIAMRQQSQLQMPSKEWLGAGAYHENIFSLDKNEDIKKIVDDANVLLDFSAAESCIRFLTFYEGSDARRITSYIFLGASLLVYLCEDVQRNIKLDYLEMCVYRQLLHTDELNHAIANRTLEQQRYGGTCTDITVSYPNGIISAFSSLVAESVKKSLLDKKATADLWMAKDDMTLQKITVCISEEVRVAVGEWEIVTDESFLSDVRSIRKEKLPNETGGVLVGSYDFEHKKIYVADIVASPEDSEEWPTGYIRGSKGLTDVIQGVEALSMGHFQYIGEWHTHPDNCSSSPSNTDKEALKYFKEHMDRACLPTLMLIVGQEDETWVIE